MKHSPAEVMRQLLITHVLGTPALKQQAWPAFVGSLPDKPPNAVALYDTQARMDGRIMRTGERITHPGFMVTIRAIDYQTGWRRATAIADLLDQVCNEQVEIEDNTCEGGPVTYTYVVASITRKTAVVPIGSDARAEGEEAKGRDLFTIDARVTLSQTAP